jgi:hypothetical protein
MHEVKPPGAEATIDGLSAEPEASQLCAPDHAVLRAREHGNSALVVDLTSHIDVKSTRAETRPRLTRHRGLA